MYPIKDFMNLNLSRYFLFVLKLLLLFVLFYSPTNSFVLCISASLSFPLYYIWLIQPDKKVLFVFVFTYDNCLRACAFLWKKR